MTSSTPPPGALTGRSQADRLQGQMAGLLCSGGPLSERSDGLAQRPLRSGEKTPPPSWSDVDQELGRRSVGNTAGRQENQGADVCRALSGSLTFEDLPAAVTRPQ
jgi:hypothetical protein